MYHIHDLQSVHESFPPRANLTDKEYADHQDKFRKSVEDSVALYKETQLKVGMIRHALHTQLWASETEGADCPDGKFSRDEAWRAFGVADKEGIVIW